MDPLFIDTSKIELKKVEMEGAKNAYMAWLISDSNAPVSFAMRIFKVERGGKIPLHSHWYYHEIFCIKGKGKVQIGDKTYILKEGMAAFVPPFVKHAYDNIGDEDWMFICVIPLKKECETLEEK